jgi:hypothetical protein
LAVDRKVEGVLALDFLPYDDGLVGLSGRRVA